MSGQQGMNGMSSGLQNMGLQNMGMQQRMGSAPQGMSVNPGMMPQPMNQGGSGMPLPQPQQMQQAMPPALGGGQQPVQMGQNPYQYGAPQTTNYLQQQASMRMPNRPY